VKYIKAFYSISPLDTWNPIMVAAQLALEKDHSEDDEVADTQRYFQTTCFIPISTVQHCCAISIVQHCCTSLRCQHYLVELLTSDSLQILFTSGSANDERRKQVSITQLYSTLAFISFFFRRPWLPDIPTCDTFVSGPWHPWILKFLAKKGCFFNFWG